MELRITGVDDLAQLAASIKAAGDKTLQRELLRSMQRAGKPLKEIARTAARENLPSEGGLNETVAASSFAIRTRSRGKSPGVRLVGREKGHDIKATDKGRLRHPVYGHDAWVTQAIPAGWFTQHIPDEALEPVRREMVAAIHRVAASIHG
jgi:hypothetical protein